MSTEPWPTDAEREALRRCRSFAAGNAFGVPLDAREKHLEYLLDSLAEHVARREREAAANALTLDELDRVVRHLFADGTRDGLILGDLINKRFGQSARRRATRADREQVTS